MRNLGRIQHFLLHREVRLQPRGSSLFQIKRATEYLFSALYCDWCNDKEWCGHGSLQCKGLGL